MWPESNMGKQDMHSFNLSDNKNADNFSVYRNPAGKSKIDDY